MKRRLAAPTLAAIVALAIVQGGAVSAHANYARSSPAPNARLERAPDRVVIGFSETPDPAKSGIDLLASDGRTVASGAQTTADPTELALPLPALAAATYLVAWHTVSAVDGDPAHGYFAFAIGPDVPASGSLQLTADGPGARATLVVSPARIGANEYRVRVTDAGGTPLANVTRVRLRIEDQDRDLGTSFVVLAPDGAEFAATGMELGLAARFGIIVEVRRQDVLDDLAFKFDVTLPRAVSATPSATPSTVAAAPSPPPSAAPPTEAIGLGIVIIALALVAGLAVRRR